MTRDEMIEQAVELASAAVHEQWMATKLGQGVSSRCSESGEELMVPYAELSEAAKDLDRGSVRATVRALADAGLLADPAQHADQRLTFELLDAAAERGHAALASGEPPADGPERDLWHKVALAVLDDPQLLPAWARAARVDADNWHRQCRNLDAELEEWRAAADAGGQGWVLRQVREALGTPGGRAVSVHAAEVRAELDALQGRVTAQEQMQDRIDAALAAIDGAQSDQDLGDALWRIEGNYNREGTGPGSRFEDQMLTTVQAKWVKRELFWKVRAALQGDQPAEPPRRQLRIDPADTCQDVRCSRIDGRCVGSHCGRCGGPSSSQGHYTSFCSNAKGGTKHHFCCPDDCELAAQPTGEPKSTPEDFHKALTDVTERANRALDAGNLDRQMQGRPPLPLFPDVPPMSGEALRDVEERDDASELDGAPPDPSGRITDGGPVQPVTATDQEETP